MNWWTMSYNTRKLSFSINIPLSFIVNLMLYDAEYCAYNYVHKNACTFTHVITMNTMTQLTGHNIAYFSIQNCMHDLAKSSSY